MIVKNEPIILLKTQLKSNFLLSFEEEKQLDLVFDKVFSKVDFCFTKTRNKYYHENGVAIFNALHSGQYTIFLYFVSVLVSGFNKDLADKVYYLNRMMNSVDLFYEVKLPNYFELDHPLGSVLGRGCYGEGFKFSQGCTVGNNKGVYPIIGDNVIMMSNSKVIGSSKVGSNVILSANTYIKDTNIPNDTVVFGQSPNLVFKSNQNI
ncbi:hypothetical protein AB4205_12985 [Vibrio sp. 10N.286.49.F3]|uniref:hypothetical protein n=1 Tax=Vibrio sp. 10N.286.49.F3 TaxID=3229704 RepID=UPI0035526950